VPDRNVALPRGNTSCEVLEVALALEGALVLRPQNLVCTWQMETHICVCNVTTSTEHKQYRLPPVLGRSLVAQQPRANHANGIDTAIPDVVNSLDATTREARGHDLACIDIRIRARSCILCDPVNRCAHGVFVGRSSAIGTTLSNGKEAVAGDVLQKRRVRATVGAACAVTPDEYGHLLGASALGRVVDGMPAQGVVRLVCAGRKGTCATTTLLRMLTTNSERTDVEVEPTCRVSTFRGDAVALSKSSAATAMAKAFFMLVICEKTEKLNCLVRSRILATTNMPAIYILAPSVASATTPKRIFSSMSLRH
jgi:hypothetical protein